MTYRLRDDGPQHVVVDAGGHGLFGVPAGDSIVVFALTDP